jgi:glutaredoxin-dependent peroxiredoxin
MVWELEVGTRVPEFELPEAFGGTVRLSEVLSSHAVVLAFYPSDWGVMCAVEMKMLQELGSRFEEAGSQVVGISTNSVFSHSAWKLHMNFTFPLLADFDGRVSGLYGVLVGDEGYMRGRSMRAVFIVDRDRTLRYRWITYDNASEPDYDRLLAVCSHLEH